MSVWTLPSPSDFERWEELLRQGVEPASAAREVGFTASAFRRSDPKRHAEAKVMSQEARMAFVDEISEKWALAPDASDTQRRAWQNRWHPAWRQNGSLEISGPEGSAVEFEISAEKLAAAALILQSVRGEPAIDVDAVELPALEPPDAA